MGLYCVDMKKLLVTKFDCPCAPSGFDRNEFTVVSDNHEEIVKRAKEITGGKDVTLCEHVEA